MSCLGTKTILWEWNVFLKVRESGTKRFQAEQIISIHVLVSFFALLYCFYVCLLHFGAGDSTLLLLNKNLSKFHTLHKFF